MIKKLANSYHNQNYDFIKQNLNNIIKDIITFYTNKNSQFLEMKKQGQEIIKIVLDDKEFFCFERQKDSKTYLPLKHTIDILDIEVNDCINFFQHNKHLTTSLKRIINNKISLLLIDLDLLDDLIKSLKSIDTNYSFKIKNILNERKSIKIPKTYVETLVKFLKVEDENAKLEMENINLKLEIEELKEKAQMYDNSLSVVNLQDMKQISSVFGIGRNSLFNFLRNRNVLIEGGEDHNLPYQKYIDSGYFIVRRVVINRTSGKELKNQTLVTAKGIGFLNRIIKNNQTNLFNIVAN